MTLLDVESLTKRYGSIVAVDDLSFSVAPGETLGLLGPNGAGKTTTMGCIVGLLEPDGGRVAVDGLAPKSKPVSAMVGYAAQRTALYLSLRVSENLAYFGGLYGLRGRSLAEAAAKIVDLFDLDALTGRRVKDLSEGQAKLVHLATAVIHEPRLLLVDEPTAGLDVSARRRVIDGIRRLAAQGTAVIFSTHYLEEADEACDSLVILDHGRRVAAGPLGELLAADPDPAAGVAMTSTLLVARNELRLLRRDPFPLFVLVGMPGVLLFFVTDAIIGGPAHSVPALASLFALMGTGSMGFSFFREHGWGTWDRLRIAPIRTIHIVAGKAIPMLAVTVCQQLILVAIGIAVFNLEVPGGPAQLVTAALGCSAMYVALAIALTSLCRTMSQLNAASMLGTMAIADAGGAIAQGDGAAGLGAGHRPSQPRVLGNRRLPQRAHRRTGLRPSHRDAARVRDPVHRRDPVGVPSREAKGELRRRVISDTSRRAEVQGVDVADRAVTLGA
ncbi:ABC transporter ATP-binding protein/permease [Candidatus Poriferisodalis sp.]|uniref:ABC transporter ATP-binding protein/permease n=1 Tax=Candidatus Poriferisodalis sp. TaxID=3101277 RepID=UPI003B5990B8